MDFSDTTEQRALRAAAAELAATYGHTYWVDKAKSGHKTTELWNEAGKLGYLGVAIPTEYGGGGGGITELAIVCEEFAAAGCPLLLLVVSPAIAATIIAQSGTSQQKNTWLPGFADGSTKMSFAITEPDAGSNAHQIITTANATDDGWQLSGSKHYISGVDETTATLVVARRKDHRTGKLRPALFIVPNDIPGYTFHPIPMEITSPEQQFILHFDNVQLPHDALIGGEDAGLSALFAGLNPERITVAAYACGIGRYALTKATDYAQTRQVWDSPIGTHQGISHPLAKAYIDIELARLATQRAAWAYDHRDPQTAQAANMAKYASAESAISAVDAAIQTHGGHGLSTEYGVGTLYGLARVGRIAPISREMILNFTAEHTLKLGKSY